MLITSQNLVSQEFTFKVSLLSCVVYLILVIFHHQIKICDVGNFKRTVNLCKDWRRIVLNYFPSHICLVKILIVWITIYFEGLFIQVCMWPFWISIFGCEQKFYESVLCSLVNNGMTIQVYLICHVGFFQNFVSLVYLTMF